MTDGPKPGIHITADPATVEWRGIRGPEGDATGDFREGEDAETSAMSQETCHAKRAALPSVEPHLSNTEVVMLAHRSAAAAPLVSDSTRLYTALFAGALGAFMLFFVAFAHSDIVHNGTHDMRHAFVAPCH